MKFVNIPKKRYNTPTMTEEIYQLDEDLNPRLVAPEAKTEEGRWFRSYLAERLTWIPQNMTNDVVDRVKSIDAEDCLFAIFSAFSSMEPGSNRDCFLGNWSWAVMNSLKRMNVTANQFRLAADAIISATPAGKKDKVRFEYGALARL